MLFTRAVALNSFVTGAVCVRVPHAQRPEGKQEAGGRFSCISTRGLDPNQWLVVLLTLLLQAASGTGAATKARSAF